MVQQIDAPLREDVRLLGNLLGETLKEHAGQDLFNQIEQIRALGKGARDGQIEAEKQLEQLFLNLKDDEILPLTRAFSHFLNFANIAEQYHVVRSRRQSECDENSPSPNVLDHLFSKFKDQQISAETLYKQICELKIELVLTAHPTEVSRRTLIQKYDGINHCLSTFDQQKLTPKQRADVLTDLKQLICSAWQTDEIRQHRPTPIDEAKWGFTTIEQTLWNAVPKFIRELDDLVQDNCAKVLPLDISPIRFASWMGVTVMVTRTSPITLLKKFCGCHAGKRLTFMCVILKIFVGNSRLKPIPMSYFKLWVIAILNLTANICVRPVNASKQPVNGWQINYVVSIQMSIAV